MKNLLKTAFILSVFLIQGCDLDLQRSFDFDEDDHPPIIEPFDITAFEYMQQEEVFDSLVVAINRAGMEDVYNGGEDDKTFLMLRNEAIEEFLIQNGYDSISDIPVDVLQSLLRYHVITERITQSDINVAEYTVFQTLIDGEDGLINLWKQREYWIIHINSSGGPDLPPTAKGTTTYLHNFEFTNGAGHHLRNYVRRVPF